GNPQDGTGRHGRLNSCREKGFLRWEIEFPSQHRPLSLTAALVSDAFIVRASAAVFLGRSPLFARRPLAKARRRRHNTRQSPFASEPRTRSGPAMKYGMNLLLWTTHVTDEHFPLLAKLKKTGFDGVEVPLFDGDAAHYARVKKELDAHGLACT